MNKYPLGPHRLSSDKVHFLVWAPEAQRVEVHLLDPDRLVPMTRRTRGYYACTVPEVKPGARYLYRLDDEKERPDPASRYQPEGVHGASAVIDTGFAWQDADWRPPVLRNSVIYEMHVGTYTMEGTFEAIIPHLPRLRDLGITTLELLPVAQFPGARNWGYDGVQPYAAHHAYGGPVGLKRLVDAAHRAGLGVMLDVVYNHLGPEGNYLWDYGPYFTDRYRTPWGAAVNFDGPHSDEVRRFFIENAIYWLDQFHIDGLRLDATHAIFDSSARPFLQMLAAAVHDWAEQYNRRVYLIAENDRSDRKLVSVPAAGGLGLDAQWLDDLHHVLHVALTGEQDGYYADYTDFALMAKVLEEGFAYTGQWSPARKRHHGTSSRDIPADRFVVCTQNHDQVGNRMLGERLYQLTGFDGAKLAAGLLMCSPYVPLLFMGQEYGEIAPFLYFTSHGDADLIEAVREGRAEEFSDFKWEGSPPDPQAAETFRRSKLNHTLRETGENAILYRLYGHLLELRQNTPALRNPHRRDTSVYIDPPARIFCIERRQSCGAYRIIFNCHTGQTQSLALPEEGSWHKIFDSGAAEWCTNGEANTTAPDTLGKKISLPAKSFAIYRRERKEA